MFDLDKIPSRKKDIFAWADYFELLCVTNIDNEITGEDLTDCIEDAEDFNVDSDIISESDLEAERDDSLEANISGYMKFLESRKALFGENYPFELSLNKITLKDNLTPPQIGYLILLFSSCLQNINSDHREILTTSFEYITEAYFQNLLSPNGQAYVVSSKNRNIGTTAMERIKWVSDQLGSELICGEREFAGNTAGEKGLDVIAWIDLGDGLTNRPIFLVQATCGNPKTFPTKVADVSVTKWRKIIRFDNSPTEVLSIPHSYRQQSNLFESELSHGEAILIDRSRILKQVTNFKDVLSETYDGIYGMIFGDSQAAC